jgi:uncharacterized protein
MSVDRAGLAVELVERLRRRGVAGDLTGVETLLRALDVLPDLRPDELYWAARVTLVHRHEDLPAFDAALADVVAELVPAATPVAPVRRPAAGEPADGALPWLTPRASAVTTSEAGEPEEPGEAVGVPRRRAAPTRALLDEEFDALTEEQVDRLGRWLAELALSWPRRTSRRRRADARGRGLALRATVARARRTGWEPVELVAWRRRPRRRRVVMLCDVSRSMRADVTPLLHLTAALVAGVGGEGLAFGTTLTRLTPDLRRGEPAAAAAAATARSADRFGGTRIAGSLHDLLASPAEAALRGAVVIIASDGWDSDRPERLAEAMARVRRRAHRVIWANPRAGAPGFEPRVATMAAALPYCDELVPVGTFGQLRDLLLRVVELA